MAEQYRCNEQGVLIGIGTIGVGIAVANAAHNIPISVYDNNHVTREKAPALIRQRLESLDRYGLLEGTVDAAFNRVFFLQDKGERDDALRADPYFVLEAVYEDLAVKTQALREISQLTPSGTLIITNSSALDPGVLSGAVKEHEHLGFWHWLNQPELTNIVEYGLADERTSPQSIAKLRHLSEKVGKYPVHVIGHPAPINTIQFAAVHAGMNAIYKLAEKEIGSQLSVDEIRQHAAAVDSVVMACIPLWLEHGAFSDGVELPKVAGVSDEHVQDIYNSVIQGAQSLVGRVETRDDIDMVVKAHAHRWAALGGVFGVVDAGGPVVFQSAHKTFFDYWQTLSGNYPTILQTQIDAGRLGWKSPEQGGFHTYTPEQITQLKEGLIQRWVDVANGEFD